MQKNKISQDDLLYEMAEALGNLIKKFDYRKQSIYIFAKREIDYARNVLAKYQETTNTMSKEINKKTIVDIFSELESEFGNDFQAYYNHYGLTENDMLYKIESKLEEDSTYPFSDVQKTLFAGLSLLQIYLTTKKHYEYLRFILDPKFDDAYIKNLLYPIFNDKSVDKITDEHNDWEVRARIILKSSTGAHDGDIDYFVDNEWNKDSSDMENLELFIFSQHYLACEQLDEIESLEDKSIIDGTNVYWKDPAGETSGYYKVDGNYEIEDEEDDAIDDRIISIINLFGSVAQVYPNELFIPKK